MPLYTTDALILRTYKLGESDRIVVFLTRDRGKKRGVAKNARQSRRRFGGALEPMTYGRVGYFERERRELVSLNFVEPVRSPLSALDGEALGYVGYFAELIDEWAQEADPNETLYRLGASMVDAMAVGVPIEPLARYFEFWLLRLQGVYEADARLSGAARDFLAAAREVSPFALGARGGDGRDASRARGGAPGADCDAPGEGSEVGARAARDARMRTSRRTATMTFQGLILKLSEFWASRGCALAAAARRRGRRRHHAPGDVPPRAGPGALERGVRPAVPPAGRRTLR